MNKPTILKRLTIVCLGIALSIFIPLLAGCSQGMGGEHQLTKDDFKQKPIPPEALKAMKEAQSHAGPPPGASK